MSTTKHNMVEIDSWTKGPVTVTKRQYYASVTFDDAGEVEEYGRMTEDDYECNDAAFLKKMFKQMDSGRFEWPMSLDDKGWESTYSLETVTE